MKLRVLFLVSALVASLVPFATQAYALPQGTKVQTYKSGLNFPVDMAWASGTRRIFYTEKNTGKIRILDGRKLRRIACARLNVNSDRERGLLGIALHPKFKRNHFLYVYYTANRSPVENRVKRFTVRDRRCRNPKVIVKGIQAHSSGTHNGGQVEFAGGKLYVSVGDAQNPGNSQNENNRLGKILRYNPNGTVPDRNPFNNPVWSFGHRNPFGLAHKPGTTKVYSTENGPNCDDEFNIIKKGRNYGWGPGYICGTKGVGPNPKGPGVRWENIIVPTDPTFYRGKLRALSGDVYTGDFGGRLRRIVMNRRDTGVRRQRVILGGQSPITDVRKGPGGWLYFATTSGIRRIVRN
ncbi:MAG: PQQ-dependent sugar dehydrogenase [Actinomycetota bacterium]|nr:PQQ-dependent sugar dehydrogenase [Actinomycetota bacterium]